MSRVEKQGRSILNSFAKSWEYITGQELNLNDGYHMCRSGTYWERRPSQPSMCGQVYLLAPLPAIIPM